MAATRAIVDEAATAGEVAYGLTTGVGVLKRERVAPDPDVGQRLVRDHRVAQGATAPSDVVRATMLRLANAFAEGSPGVRPQLVERLVEALARDEAPPVRFLGSLGQADLAPMADLAAQVFAGMDLAPGEGLAVVSSNAFATGWATLAIDDAAGLGVTLETAGACALEGLGANATLLHPRIAEVRPYPGLAAALARLRSLLAGSAFLDGSGARSLQDPLTFRNLPHLAGAWRDALAHADAQLAIELNASESNPIVVPDERRLVSVANFEALPLAAALDYLRIVLASIMTASAERSIKLLETPWTGLPTGLNPPGGAAGPGLAYLGIAVQALAAEARLLAQPVSAEVVSTAHAEGIEDRATHGVLGARRLADQVALGRRIAAVELAVACQAMDLRGGTRGGGTAAALRIVRTVVPTLEPGAAPPDLEPLVSMVAAGRLGHGLSLAWSGSA